MKRFLALACTITTVLSMSACFWQDAEESDTESVLSSDSYTSYDESEPAKTEEPKAIMLDGTNILDYAIVVPQTFDPAAYSFANEIISMVEELTGERIKIKFDSVSENGKEIIIGNTQRAESKEYESVAKSDGYFIKGMDNGNIVAIFNTDVGRREAMNRIESMLKTGTVMLKEEPSMIVSSIGGLRDPFILVEDGIFEKHTAKYSDSKSTVKLIKKYTSIYKVFVIITSMPLFI